MFEFLNDVDNYEDRRVARHKLENGIEVSTVYSSDEGYETALLDTVGTHPVERYPGKEEAIEGHGRWLEFARNYSEGMEVTKLGCLDNLVGDEQIVLSL